MDLRTQLQTLASCELVLGLVTELGLDVEEWLFADADKTQLEACQAHWRPVVRGFASDPHRVPSVAESVAAFNQHVVRWSGPGGRVPGI